jgi:preprotein translocase subunit YajC
MNSFVFSLLLGAPDAAASGGAASGGNFLTTLLPFVAIFGVMYFLIIRPQNKKQKEAKKMLESMKKGDEVETIGGMRGVIHRVDSDTVIVELDKNTKVRFVKGAIAKVFPGSRPEIPEKKSSEEKEADTAETGEEFGK